MPRKRKPALDCCKQPALGVHRRLIDTARRDLTVEACAHCGAFWLHDVWEVAMNGDFDELEFHRYAHLAAEEVSRLPETAEHLDLGFLAERDVLTDAIGGREWVKGWAP